jgi:hypothetical protein
MSSDKVYLIVPYAYKDDAKNMGAKWSSTFKIWYIYEDNSNYHYLINMYNEKTVKGNNLNKKLGKKLYDKEQLILKNEHDNLHCNLSQLLYGDNHNYVNLNGAYKKYSRFSNDVLIERIKEYKDKLDKN